MKTGIIAGVLAAVLGLSSVADACHKGHHHGKGVKGTVTSVGKSSLSLSVPSSNGSEVYTVKFNRSTTITGTSSHAITSSLVGSSATVVGPEEGTTISASEIVVAG